MNVSQFILPVIILGVIFLVVSFFKKSSGSSNVNGVDYSSKPLMTGNEIEFFGRLTRALPQYYVFPQVSLGAILNGTIEGKATFQSRSFFSQKIADYVVCDRKMKIIAIVELDDVTHDSEKDKKRDAVLNAAGYTVIRWHSKRKPSMEEISHAFARLKAA